MQDDSKADDSIASVHEELMQMLRSSGRHEIALIDTATEVAIMATTERTEIFGATFAAIDAKVISSSLGSGKPFSIGAYSYHVAKKLRPDFRKLVRSAATPQDPQSMLVWSITIQVGSFTHCLLGSTIEEVIELVSEVISPSVRVEKSGFRKTRDRGRKVGAAAKDKVRLNGCLVGLELLQSLEAAGVAHDTVSKQTVLAKPTLDGLRENQVPPAVALMIVHAYRLLARTPRDTAECRNDFVARTPTLFKTFETCSTVRDVRNIIFKSLGQDRKQSVATFGKAFVALGWSSTGSSSAYVFTLERIERTGDVEEAWKLAQDSLVRKPTSISSDGKLMPSRTIKKLSELKRKGPALKSSQLDLLGAEFGFTGIEVGEWVNRPESEMLLKLVAEAFYDLRRILGPWIVGLNRKGNLALALGARGKGRACAHFEPRRSVINLSKQKGDGSLAHEWAHFLDLQLAKYGAGDEPYLSERSEKPTNQASTTHPIGKAMFELMRVMKSEKAVEEITGNPNCPRWYLKRWIVKVVGEQVGNAQQNYDLISEKFSNSFVSGKNARENSITLVNSFSRLTKAPVQVRIQYLKDREYFSDAKVLGKYWSSSVELFARAFESFVEDQLYRRTCLSEFLVYGTRNDYSNFCAKPYPEGSQRKEINRAIGNLITTIKENG